jgi:hypothetical protein
MDFNMQSSTCHNAMLMSIYNCNFMKTLDRQPVFLLVKFYIILKVSLPYLLELNSHFQAELRVNGPAGALAFRVVARARHGVPRAGTASVNERCPTNSSAWCITSMSDI